MDDASQMADRKNKVKLNNEKTTTFFFTSTGHSQVDSIKIKFLGFILDQKLIWE